MCVWTRGKQEAILVGAISGCESQITSARLMSGGVGVCSGGGGGGGGGGSSGELSAEIQYVPKLHRLRTFITCFHI